MPSKAKKDTGKKKPSSIQDFKKKSRARAELELPSGAAIIAKGVSGMSEFMKAGIIPNNLLSIVQEAIDKGQEPDMDSFLKKGDDGNVSPEAIQDMMDLIDAVTIKCWILPPVAAPPENDEDRSDETLYTDDVDDQDKLFVFQWAIGGTSNLERFREEQAAGMDRLRSGESVADDT